MSTQFTTSIPLSFAHTLAPVRLLELPPALLALLSSDTPPTLKIKASDGSTSAHSTDNHAVLCTGTQTFSLRQVYSSNSIILLQPSPPPVLPADDTADPLTLLQPSMGLKAVSTTPSYLELIPTIHDAESLLLKHIPLYSPHPTDTPPQQASKAALINALPISETEFETAWNKLHCFSCPQGFAHRPSPSAVLKTLDEIFTSAAAESLPLCPRDGFGVDSIVAILDDDDDDAAIPPGLVHAAITGVCEEAASGRWKLETAKCAAYVGRMLLEDWGAKAKGDMLYVSFISRWKSSVPEECRELCKLETIKGWYMHPTPNTIRFVSGGATQDVVVPAGTARNKWHEKFGKGKRR